MTIEIIDELDGGGILELLTRAISFAAGFETKKDNFELSLTITDDARIQALNREFRNIDRSTDVLSFPLIQRVPGGTADFWKEEDINPDTGCVMLGDIVLSLETAARQAEEYGHSLEREAAYLCVHSVLHLLGYDHIDEQDKKIMRAREEEIMNAFGLGR